MGCCEIRNDHRETKPLGEQAAWESYNKQATDQVSQPSAKPILSQEETEVLVSTLSLPLLELYTSRLIEVPEWRTHFDKNRIFIKSLTASIFSDKIPVILASLDFGKLIPISIIEDFIVHDRSWDLSLISFNLLKQENDSFNGRLVKKYPFKNREFFVKLHLNRCENLTSLFFTHLENDSIDESVERGIYWFLVMKIQEMEKSTHLMVVSQVDSKQGTAQNLSGLAANEMYQWLFMLRSKAVEFQETILNTRKNA